MSPMNAPLRVTLTIEIRNWCETSACKYAKSTWTTKILVMVEHKALKCNITNYVIQVVDGDHWPHPPSCHYANVFSSKPKKIQKPKMTHDPPWYFHFVYHNYVFPISAFGLPCWWNQVAIAFVSGFEDWKKNPFVCVCVCSELHVKTLAVYHRILLLRQCFGELLV